jgi:hypothetical protein|eukprot:COSAG01_NODE_3741_length_5745_cov_23.297202_2_plen_80_part_00
MLGRDIGFQKDTIFVGLGSWPGEPVPSDFTSIIPEIPGYIGLVPLKNSAPENAMYLQRLQQYEAAHRMPISTSISKYGT